jgi:hypothetical protein
MRSTLKLTAFAALAAMTVAATGCNEDARRVAQEPTPSPQPNLNTDNPPQTGPDGDPLPTPSPSMAPAPVANYSGVYEVVAPLDFTQNGVLPGIVSPLLAGLTDLHDHPGKALYEILAGSNIPYISDLMNKLPGFLVSGLEALLDDLITKNLYQGYPVVDQVTGIISGIAEVTKTMDLHDTITIHKPAADMSVNVEQQLHAVGFTLLGTTQVVPIPAASMSKALSKMPGKLTPHSNAPVADADVTISDGTFSIPYGSLLLEALGPLLFNQFGGAMDLAGALKNMVPCADFGQTIVDNSGGIITDPSVGKDLCEGALGLVADAITKPINDLTLDDVKATMSVGKLYDVSMKVPKMDNQSDRLAEGKWNWSFTVSGGTATVPSTFAGDRTGPAN